MTLDEMLALLPDNETGEISAGDLRSIVIELYEMAAAVGQAFAYKWTTDLTPNTGQVTMDQGWSMNTTHILISETTDDGMTLGFTLVDEHAEIWISGSEGAVAHAEITAAPTDLGTYRDVPVVMLSVDGSAPNNNAKATVTMKVRVVQ